MCKNFLSLEKYLEIGFFIHENSKLKVKEIQSTWGNTSITLNATVDTRIAESVAMPATDCYLIEASVDLLAVSENASGSTTYILFSVKNGSSVISTDQAFPLDYHGVRKSLFFMYWLSSGTKLGLWVQTDKKRVSAHYLFRIYRLFTA